MRIGSEINPVKLCVYPYTKQIYKKKLQGSGLHKVWINLFIFAYALSFVHSGLFLILLSANKYLCKILHSLYLSLPEGGEEDLC